MKGQKVRAGEKISYLMANIGNIPLMTLLSSFFMIYYTDVVGLDPATLATLFLISKIMDAISDPVMGFLLDKFPITKMGKFRPMLILGTIICSINYALLWFGPVWMPQFKYIVVYVTYLLLGWTFDIMDISLNSLLPVMTDDDKERNSLSLIKAVGYIVGGLVVAIGGPIIVADGRLESYYILIFGSLAIVVVFSIVGALGVHERVSFSGEDDEKYSIPEMFKFMTCKPVAVTFLSSLIGFVGSQMASSAGTYFYTYVIGDLTKMSLVTVLAAVGVFPTMIISPILANKWGKRKVYIIGTFFAWAMGFLRVLAPTSLTLLYGEERMEHLLQLNEQFFMPGWKRILGL